MTGWVILLTAGAAVAGGVAQWLVGYSGLVQALVARRKERTEEQHEEETHQESIVNQAMALINALSGQVKIYSDREKDLRAEMASIEQQQIHDIQALKERIRALELRVTELEVKNSHLEAENTELKAALYDSRPPVTSTKARRSTATRKLPPTA